jgi:hypothetical protein
MKTVQEIFDQIQEARREMKDINRAYKDALDSASKYKETLEEYKKIREKKQQIERSIKQDSSKEFARLESLKNSIKGDQEMLSDVALNHIVKGETVGLTDENNNHYEPIFSVKFKKKI